MGVVTWQVRIYIIRAEWLFHEQEYRKAMQEVMKAIGLSSADRAVDHDSLTELLRRIVRARSEQRAGDSGSSSWDFHAKEEEDSEETRIYNLLGVARNATDAEVKKAYRQLALKWHPDKHPDDKEKAEEMFLSITEAYEYILADMKRQQRAGQSSSPGSSSGKDKDEHDSEESTQDESNETDGEQDGTGEDGQDGDEKDTSESSSRSGSEDDGGSGHD